MCANVKVACIFVRIVGLCITSMLECLFLTKGKFIYASNIFITRPEHYQKFNPLNLGDLAHLIFRISLSCSLMRVGFRLKGKVYLL